MDESLVCGFISRDFMLTHHVLSPSFPSIFPQFLLFEKLRRGTQIPRHESLTKPVNGLADRSSRELSGPCSSFSQHNVLHSNILFLHQNTMSAFEKLPQEVRDMIYGYCLIHHDAIIPFPTMKERNSIKRNGQEPARLWLGAVDQNLHSNCHSKVYAADWPSVALLGVNKTVNQEAAKILFGKNTWHLSYIRYLPHGEESRFWRRYAKYFRHISIRFTMNDVLPRDLFRTTNVRRSLPGSYNERTLAAAIHDDRIWMLAKTFAWKRRRLLEMNLDSLIFDVEDLFCPNGCCRSEILEILCVNMGREGIWYALKPHMTTRSFFKAPSTHGQYTRDIETKRQRKVEVVGLVGDEEKDIFERHWGWGFKVESVLT